MFVFKEIEYYKNPIQEGEYIDINNHVTQNTIFTKGHIPYGLYIKYFFEEDIFNKEVIKTLTKPIKTHQNRGAISGIIDENKLFPCYHQYLNNDTKFNSSYTRVQKSENCKYAFSNNMKYAVINENKKYYKNNREYIDKTLFPLVNKINRIGRQYLDMPIQNNIFGSFNEVIINRSVISATHRDYNNKSNISALVSLSLDNKLDVSYLGLPDLDISIPMVSGKSLLLFDLKNNRHSNNEIPSDKLDGRLSLVFYNK